MEAYLAQLVKFIGYGRLDAPLWFLGREEGLGRRPKHPGWSLEWELEQRSAWEPVMDARQAHEKLNDPYWEEPGKTKVWDMMSMLACGLLQRAPDWQAAGFAARYTVDHLGRAHGQTLLGEAFPLPKARISSWPYTSLFPDQKTYRAAIWSQRQVLWQGLLAKYHPRIVIAYGGWWQSRGDTFGKVCWQILASGRVQAGIMPTGTHVYLTPHFGRGRITMEDMQGIVEHALHE